MGHIACVHEKINRVFDTTLTPSETKSHEKKEQILVDGGLLSPKTLKNEKNPFLLFSDGDSADRRKLGKQRNIDIVRIYPLGSRSSWSPSKFQSLAKRYILSEANLPSGHVCVFQYNAGVAKSIGLVELSHMWQMLSIFFGVSAKRELNSNSSTLSKSKDSRNQKCDTPPSSQGILPSLSSSKDLRLFPKDTSSTSPSNNRLPSPPRTVSPNRKGLPRRSSEKLMAYLQKNDKTVTFAEARNSDPMLSPNSRSKFKTLSSVQSMPQIKITSSASQEAQSKVEESEDVGTFLPESLEGLRLLRGRSDPMYKGGTSGDYLGTSESMEKSLRSLAGQIQDRSGPAHATTHANRHRILEYLPEVDSFVKRPTSLKDGKTKRESIYKGALLSILSKMANKGDVQTLAVVSLLTRRIVSINEEWVTRW
eukprot:CAMPEP_0167746866 /NCGR_PEP_ID=MMETSP0110_2-20121227/3954_1 /TAXON_ID=629695 /ORGANISM="Gymnochlora sp., Strain CCMP2014" /LENGTH=421 /DNA_ID=CAMNT_0007631685 /DNA_START=310 /DNA_END=1572 /DNA_ORIENTATION=-